MNHPDGEPSGHGCWEGNDVVLAKKGGVMTVIGRFARATDHAVGVLLAGHDWTGHGGKMTQLSQQGQASS